jgi:hypothetical protein
VKANTPAYCNTKLIAAVKSFTAHGSAYFSCVRDKEESFIGLSPCHLNILGEL